MFTPQQIDQISFSRAKFGGYDMQQVDEFLEPLTEDYVTLYKENGLLKSKMRVLVGKLEEYRKNEAAMYSASHVESATTLCLELHQLTAPPLRINTYPVCDLESSGSVSKLAST